jgi:cytochrome c5
MEDAGFEHAHSSPIKTPQQLVVVIVLAFAIPVIGIILLTQFITSEKKTDASTLAPEAVAARIQPVARVEFADTPAGPRAQQSGEEVYKMVCAACHAQGVAGAPKLGDKAAWASHIKQGLDALVKNAINGVQSPKGVMPPKGGNTSLSDWEVAAAVVYMANQAGANFKEPAKPAAAAAPATAAATPPAARTGEQIVQAVCGNCHLTGERGAPKIGDRAAWSKRISGGLDAVVLRAIRGHGEMPARGGFTDLTDPEMKQAVLYMFETSGAKLIPAAGAAAAAAPTQVAAAAPPATPAVPAAGANADQLLQKYGCLACHALDKKVIGPSYKDVAAKFGADKNAVSRLAQRVKGGSVGDWGQVPMPPNPQVPDADLEAMLKFILAQK